MPEEKKIDNYDTIVNAARLSLSRISLEEINKRIPYYKIGPENVDQWIGDTISINFDNEEFIDAMSLCDELGIELQIKGE